MATDRSFIDYVAEQAGLEGRLTSRRMFGEYALYLSGRVVAFAADNSLYVKAFDATQALTADLPARPFYPGGKPYPLADELLDDPERLRALLIATEACAPEPVAKPPRKRTVKR